MNRSFLLTTCLSCALLAALPTMLPAITLTVTNTASTGPGTLDEAIFNANSGDTIVFSVPLPATIVVTNGPAFVEANITISGPGADKLTISGDGTNRIFFIDSTAVTISGVTLSNGVTSSNNFSFFEGGGGAIVNFGDLTISRCTLKNNLSKGGDGHGIGGGGGAGGGGAIFNDGFLLVVDSTLSGNQAIGGAGDRAGGGGGAGFGGAVFNDGGDAVLSNCTFSANAAMGGTAGIATDGDTTGNGGDGLNNQSGGTGEFLAHNGSDGGDAFVDGGGGGGASDAAQLTGICDGDIGGFGGFGAFGGGGGAAGRGADGCVTNAPGDGGNGGNGGDGGGGGFGGGGAGAGAGGQPTGVGTLTGSMGNPGLGGLGGGNGVSTNGGGGAGIGGAIFNNGGTLLIVHCTIASNSVAGGASAGHVADGTGITGGVYNYGGEADVLDTIIAGNRADLDPDVATNMDLGADFTSEGNNLIGIGDGSTAFVNGTNGDLVGSAGHPLDPKLGPLANNGGPTFTHALLDGSPAVDAGADDDCSGTDQRGVPRPRGPHCDIGAFELNHPPVARCQNVTVSLVSGCTTNVSVNNGSSDPDVGDIITLSQSPAGPYTVGTNTVTLTVADNAGGTNSCTATVTVVDHIPPTITCPSTLVTAAATPAGAVVTFSDPVASDNCSATVTCEPPSGSTFPVGDSTVNCTASDPSGNTNSCSFTVHVKSVSEQLSDTDALISGLGLDSRAAAKLHQSLRRITMQVNRHHTGPACRQILSLVTVTEHQLALGRLTDFQAVRITTPLIQMHSALGCS